MHEKNNTVSPFDPCCQALSYLGKAIKTDEDRSQIDSSLPVSFSPAAYRRFVPIGCWIKKKLLDLLFPFTNISLKHNISAVEAGYFCYYMSYFARK
jgi:hypothetical protein